MALFSRSTQPAPAAIETEGLAPNALIGLRNIEKSYAHGTSRSYVLRRINVDIKEGEFVSIMGPSGAGKSTLLHIIGMHDSAWTGEYYFLDQPVHRLGAKERAKLHKQYIGFVFQSYHLLDHLTVYENLDIPLSYRDIKKSDRESMVCDILDKFAIVGKKDLYPNQLSGGQQQLVAVARAVISNPEGHPGRRADRQPAHEPGQGDHGAVQEAQRGGTTIIQVTHSEDQRQLRQPRHPPARRLDRRRIEASRRDECRTAGANGKMKRPATRRAGLSSFAGIAWRAGRSSTSGAPSAARRRSRRHRRRRRIAATATATTAAAAATAAAEAAFRLRPRFVHHQRAAVHLMLVELGDGLLRVVVVSHLDERESARAAGGHVAHHPDVVHLAGPAEQLRQLVLRGRIGKVADVESPAHAVTYSWLNARVVLGSAPTPGARASDTPPRAANAVGKLTRFAVRRGVTGPAQATAGALIYQVEYSRMRTCHFVPPHPRFHCTVLDGLEWRRCLFDYAFGGC